jgi:hypothetical protein
VFSVFSCAALNGKHIFYNVTSKKGHRTCNFTNTTNTSETGQTVIEPEDNLGYDVAPIFSPSGNLITNET